MESKRRTQAERSAATQEKLIAAARKLWGERGYADVGTPEIAREAGVTRGAMYHQFSDKADLFSAVAEAVEQEVTSRLAERVASAGVRDASSALRAAADGWLMVSQEPEVRQILLVDGPVVLGWERFRDLLQRYGLGLTETLLEAAMREGKLPRRPTRPLAHVVIGALNEAAMYVAAADEPAQAYEEARAIVGDLLAGLVVRADG
jgi:AcrR family transcriptional regulator